MKKDTFLSLIVTLILSFQAIAQIKGTIHDDKGKPLPFVAVFEENTYNGTSSNEQGKFELNVTKPGKHKIIFQFLGYKTQIQMAYIQNVPFVLDVVMQEENFNLNEVVINKKNNPADEVIKNTIAAKKDNASKTARFKADFYSRGIFKVKDLPKKIMGIKLDLDDKISSNLDSTGSGIIYLSETVSKLMFEKPNSIKEKIIASKISGNDKGFSYNTARSTAYDFYDNTLLFNVNMISPIANNAFNYYKYKLEGTFFDENNQQIYKIKVTPKRENEPVFEGYMYIVDDSFALYGVDFFMTGNRLKNEFIEQMEIKQNFSYNSKSKIWAKNVQTLSFSAGIFGTKLSGKFNYVYSNYEFQNAFNKKTFDNEILSFEDNANKKDPTFWLTNRQVPLTKEESLDYKIKDSIQTVHSTRKYKDSIDSKQNKYALFDFITGYRFKNSFKKYEFNYNGLLDISSLSYNTVQGYSLSTGFSFRKANEENGKNTTINIISNYGFNEKRIRLNGEYKHRFNNQNYSTISVAGGTTASQFNSSMPISNLINSVSTLFFRNNFMKLYNKEYLQINFNEDIANGLNFDGKLEYQQRKPLFNSTDFSIIKSDKLFTSNNPIDPNEFYEASFVQHHLTKLAFDVRINFGNKYLTRPDGKFNIRNKLYPTIHVNYETAFAANSKQYEFKHISTRLFYEVTAGNKGIVFGNFKAGKFLNAETISIIDYKHFNGNQTHVGQSDRYLNVFNLMPYYSNSTNNAYFETHIEYIDNRFIMNKIPLLNLLKVDLVAGFHNLAIPKRSPYQEVSVGLNNFGFGKFKIFRIDYIRSYQNGFKGDGFVFGCKFLNVLE